MGLLDELQEIEEEKVVKKKPRLSYAVETAEKEFDNQVLGNLSVADTRVNAKRNQERHSDKSQFMSDSPLRLTRSQKARSPGFPGTSVPDSRQGGLSTGRSRKSRVSGGKSSTAIEREVGDHETSARKRHGLEGISDISLSIGRKKGRDKQSESFRVTRARSANFPEEVEILDSPPLLVHSKAPGEYGKAIQSNLSNAIATSLRQSSLEKSLTNHDARDEQEHGVRIQTGREEDVTMNRSRTRGSQIRSVFVPETCPDSENQEEMHQYDDEMVPETQPIPGDVRRSHRSDPDDDEDAGGDDAPQSEKSTKAHFGSTSGVSQDDVESEREPVQPRESIVKSNGRGRHVTADNSDASCSSGPDRWRESKKYHQMVPDRQTDSQELEGDEGDEEPIPRNIREQISNQSMGAVNNVDGTTDKITEIIGTPKIRKEIELTLNKHRVLPPRKHPPLYYSPRSENRRHNLNSPHSLNREEMIREDKSDKEDEEISVGSPMSQNGEKEKPGEGQQHSMQLPLRGKAKRMIRQDSDADEDEENTLAPSRRRSQKKLSVVHEEIEEHFGFGFDKTVDDGKDASDVDDPVNDNDNVSVVDNENRLDDDDIDDNDIDNIAGEDGDADANDGSKDVVGEPRQEEQAGECPELRTDEFDEIHPEKDDESRSCIGVTSKGIGRGDKGKIQESGSRLTEGAITGRNSFVQTTSRVAEDDDDEEFVGSDVDTERNSDGDNQMHMEKENPPEERRAHEEMNQLGSISKHGKQGKRKSSDNFDDLFDISGVKPHSVSRAEFKINVMDNAKSPGDKKHEDVHDASRASTTRNEKPKKKRKNMPGKYSFYFNLAKRQYPSCWWNRISFNVGIEVSKWSAGLSIETLLEQYILTKLWNYQMQTYQYILFF
jgi:hypothetical protein